MSVWSVVIVIAVVVAVFGPELHSRFGKNGWHRGEGSGR
jgi:Sec-independent protein translocase protein TatA